MNIGNKEWYYVEKIRQIFKFKKSEIVFDHLPGLLPFMEIESPNENEFHEIMTLLNLSKEPPFGGNDLYEKHYGITKNRPLGRLDFQNVEERFKKYISYNREKMIEILNKQREMIKQICNKS